MEAQSVSPSVTPSLEVTKDEQEASNNQSATENTLQSEDSLQEVPEKKQKVSRTRSRPKTPRKTSTHRHRKPRVPQEPSSDSVPSPSSASSPQPTQAHSSSDLPAEPETVVLLDGDDDTTKISKCVPVEICSVDSSNSSKVVYQSELSPAALVIWKDILKKEVQLHELSKKAESVMSVLNSQIELCRSLGVDVLSVDHKISDLMEFKMINRK